MSDFEITSLVLSILAILISVFVLLKDIIIFRKNLKIKVNKIHLNNDLSDETYYSLIVFLTIENRNQYPITITNSYIGTLSACPCSFCLMGDEFVAFNQTSSYEITSLKLPFPIEAFKATELTALTFLSKDKIELNKSEFLIIETTRGNIEIDITEFITKD